MTACAAPEHGCHGPEALACASSSELSAIEREGTSLVVWRRPPIERLVRLLDPLPPEALPHLRLEELPAAAIAAALEEALSSRTKALAALLDDVAHLAKLYGSLTGRRTVRLRLERVTDNACRRFHADHVRLRLLCTYRGPGTEWIAASDVRLAADGALAEPEPAAIRRLGRFDVGLFKGTAWRGGQPCFHRSPPVAGTGMARILLCIDEGDGC